MRFWKKLERVIEGGVKVDTVGRVAGIGRASLRAAYVDEKAPRQAGVYFVYCDGHLVKVGKAADGLWKRFGQYWRGDASGGLRHITKENRDRVSVSWKTCAASEARQLEVRLYKEAKARGEAMPWSARM